MVINNTDSSYFTNDHVCMDTVLHTEVMITMLCWADKAAKCQGLHYAGTVTTKLCCYYYVVIIEVQDAALLQKSVF